MTAIQNETTQHRRREISVNGVAIAPEAVAAEVQNYPARAPGHAWKHAAEALVIRELLRQEVERLGLEAEPEVDSTGRRETLEDAAIRVLLGKEVALPTADEEALRRFYDRNARKFMSPALYEAEHILVAASSKDAAAFERAHEKAENIRGALDQAPGAFADLARAHSDCPSAKLGGSLGQVQAGDTTPEFDAALNELAEGGIAGPVRTRYGWHIIHLSRRIEGRLLPFEAVRARIKSYLELHVQHQAYAQYIQVLIGKADIKGLEPRGATGPLLQ